jgi:hypothetical protein
MISIQCSWRRSCFDKLSINWVPFRASFLQFTLSLSKGGGYG